MRSPAQQILATVRCGVAIQMQPLVQMLHGGRRDNAVYAVSDHEVNTARVAAHHGCHTSTGRCNGRGTRVRFCN